jgi:hypothetical protein
VRAARGPEVENRMPAVLVESLEQGGEAG